MRFDVHKVRTYLINGFNEATDTVASIRHDGTDVVILELYTGESVVIHLVERLMPVNELRDTLNENTEAGLHTLFILWSDLLLPQEDQYHLPEDWMEVLMTLYQGKIYGYDSYGPYASVFPVRFEKPNSGLEYYVTYGDAIKASYLRCDTVRLETRHLTGTWRVADFSREAPRSNGQQRDDGARLPNFRRRSLAEYYDVLEIPSNADRAAVRQAYHQLARLYHPDINSSPDSTNRMQEINEAYQRIMEQFEKDT